MTNIIKRREHIVTKTFHFDLTLHDEPGRGYSFPCDEHGTVAPDKRERLAELLATGKYEAVVRQYDLRYIDPAVIRCACGSHVELRGFTNTCRVCERDYNMSGSELADRSQWGEETGETVSDVLAADTDTELGG
jgi:hypothetical protein